MNAIYQVDFDNAIKNIPFHNYLHSSIQEIVTPLMNYFEAQAASIFIKVGTNLPYDIACFGSDGFTLNLSGIAQYKSGEGTTGKVFKTGKAVIDNKLQQKQQAGKYDMLKPNPNTSHNTMVVPLFHNGQIIGVAKVEDKQKETPFTVEDFDDLKNKALQIAKVLYKKAIILQYIPFLSSYGGYDIFPPASLALVPFHGSFYVGGIRSIKIIEKNGRKTPIIKFFLNYLEKQNLELTQENFQQILKDHKDDISYDISTLGEGTISDIKQGDLKLFNELIQMKDFVHFKFNNLNAKFENKGSIENIDYKNFILTIKVTEGDNAGSIQKVPFWNIRKVYDYDTVKKDKEDYQKIFAPPQYNFYEGDKVSLTSLKIKNTFFKDITWFFSSNINVLFGQNGFGKTYLLRILASLAERKQDFLRDNGFLGLNENDSGYLCYLVKEKNYNVIYDAKLLLEEFAEKKDKVPILYIPAVRFLPPNDIKESFTGDKPFYEILAEDFIEGVPLAKSVEKLFYHIGNFHKEYETKEEEHPFIEIIYNAFNILTRDVAEDSKKSSDIIKITNVKNDDLTKTQILIHPEGMPEGDAIFIQQASSGVISTWVLLGFIYLYLEDMEIKTSKMKKEKHKENDKEEEKKPEHTGNGIVVIDEIEVHMHPEWQRKIVKVLRESFPNVQFIMTSHSPLVAASCDKGEVAMLEKNGKEGYSIQQFDEEFISKPLEEIYERALDNTKPHSQEYEELLKSYEDGKLDKIKNKLDKLNQKEEKSELNPEEKLEYLKLASEFKSILKIGRSDLEKRKRKLK